VKYLNILLGTTILCLLQFGFWIGWHFLLPESSPVPFLMGIVLASNWETAKEFGKKRE
jgi:hypothetical protein